MFCVKCGVKIKETDRFCPQCGAKNENYMDRSFTAQLKSMPKEERKSTVEDILSKTGNSLELPPESPPDKKKRFKIIVPLMAVAVVAVLVLAFIPKLLKKDPGSAAEVQFGISAYVDVEDNAYFVMDGETIELGSSVDWIRTTPDKSKYVMLATDGTLSYRKSDEANFSKVAEGVSYLRAINNECCFYEKEGGELIYLDLQSGEQTELGFEDYDVSYSQGHSAVAGVDSRGQLYVFAAGDDAPASICNIGENAKVSAVLDDGSSVVWSEDNFGDVDVFMLKNGVPERIGNLPYEIKRASGVVTAKFFANGKSLVVCAQSCCYMLAAIDGGEVKQVPLPGGMKSGDLLDRNGNTIESESDDLSEFYLQILNSVDDDVWSMYRWVPGKDMEEVASDIFTKDWSNWFRYRNSQNYFMVDGVIYYEDGKGDFCKKPLAGKAGQEAEKITTDIEAAYIPKTGKYAYIVKNDSVYYVDLADKDHKLNVICDGFTPKDVLYTTDKPDIIYYIKDAADIGETVWTKGVLYRYDVGKDSTEIAEDIVQLRITDSLIYNSQEPVIEQYVSHEDSSITSNIGVLEDGKFVVKVENIKQ